MERHEWQTRVTELMKQKQNKRCDGSICPDQLCTRSPLAVHKSLWYTLSFPVALLSFAILPHPTLLHNFPDSTRARCLLYSACFDRLWTAGPARKVQVLNQTEPAPPLVGSRFPRSTDGLGNGDTLWQLWFARMGARGGTFSIFVVRILASWEGIEKRMSTDEGAVNICRNLSLALRFIGECFVA